MRRWSLVATVLLVLVVPLAWADAVWWRFGLLHHFPLQCGLAAAITALALAVVGPRRWALLPAAVACWHFAWIAPAWMGPGISPQVTASGGVHLRVLTANLLLINPDPDAAAEAIARVDADVIACQEVTPVLAAALARRLSAYPHRLVVAQDDAFGIALYSRLPVSAIDERTLDEAVPSIVATVVTAGGPVTVIASHPVPPGSHELADLNRQHLDALARLVRDLRGPVVVMGDLNATPWCPGLRSLLRVSGLSDTRLGHGNQASWPAGLGRFGIPIDHVLVRGLVARERRVVASVGSDHNWVACDLVDAGP